MGAIGLGDVEGVEEVEGVVDELDHGEEVELSVVVLAGVLTVGVAAEGELAGVVDAGVDDVLDEEVSGETAQPDGSLIGSGVLVEAGGVATESLIASRRSDIDRGATSGAGVAATGDGVLSVSFSSVVAALSWLVLSWLVLLVPAARLPSPPATGAASLALSSLALSCL
jgi:hypothetical protein